MKVEQFKSKNQFHIYNHNDDNKIVDCLQSYDSLVVSVETITNKNLLQFNTTIKLGVDWDYSTTTSKYVYMFLEEYGNISFNGINNKRAYINKLIKDGIIIYDEELR